jgi:ribosomal protein L37AE/L43A
MYKVESDSIEMITVKVCPGCDSRIIYKRKNKKGYRCDKCKTTFPNPAFKKVTDFKRKLPIPIHLRGKEKV